MRTLILILIAYGLNAQNVVFDTSWIESKIVDKEITENDSTWIVLDTVFFLTYKMDFSDGSYNTRSSYIGNKDALYIQGLQKMESKAAEIANKVVSATAIQREITYAIQENTGVIAISGQSPLDTLTIKTAMVLTNNDFIYEIVSGSDVKNISFALNSQGKLRYVIDGQTAKAVWGFDKWIIRLVNYNGSPLDLFWDENRKRYVSQDGKTILRRINPNN
jgi:hypothetical protein